MAIIRERGNKLWNKDFRGFVNQVVTNLYMHATTENDIMKEVKERQEKEQYEKFKLNVQRNDTMNQLGDFKRKAHELGKYEWQKINYVEDLRKNINFDYMQSLALIAAYIAGINNESADARLFEKSSSLGKLRVHAPK